MSGESDIPPILPRRTEVLVIGSGAGGAVTAATLAARGYEVLVLEEGPAVDTAAMTTNSPQAIAALYRNAGVTPIFGSPNIAFVEGRCVGGSTEVNSAFWHRLPADCYHRWRADARLADFSEAGLAPYFEELERDLSVSYLGGEQVPRSSELFRRGIEKMKWRYAEVPRCQRNDASSGPASPFAPGNKQSMQRTYIPKALDAGARLVADCRALRLLGEGGRVTGAMVQQGTAAPTSIIADHVFVCCGAVQTAALLRRSGITHNVGDNLCIHPMLKVAALFDEAIGADSDVLPIYQVQEFWPNIAIGGSVFTPGFLAMLLSDNWQTGRAAMRDWSRMALFYTATRGMSRGVIRNVPGGQGALIRYRLTGADRANLSEGLAHLGEILFAAGARLLYPSLRSQPIIESVAQCRGFLAAPLPAAAMNLSTVHAFSSCPMGENPDLCATDSFGRVSGFRNLYVNDASLIPDSPGVNPQGTIMAIARRNVDHFDQSQRVLARRRPSETRPAPAVLVTGAPGWLGTRLLEILRDGMDGGTELGVLAGGAIRCLVHPATDAAAVARISPRIEVVVGDVTDPAAARELCDGAGGAVAFHIAGIIHPHRYTRELEAVNVEGTRHLLSAATAAGVRRVVAVSSNSPFGFNAGPEHRFDEASPYAPHMAYGRSKRRMELLAREAHAAGAIETVIIRPPWFYGPHQPARQTRFFQMIRAGRFPILGDGRQRRSMAYVDNICQGLLLAATVQRAAGETYWIADERPYTVREIVETVREVLENELGLDCASRQLHLPAAIGSIALAGDGVLQACGLYNQQLHVLGEMRHTIACSIDKAVAELGYAPRVRLYEGMLASVRWCLANGLYI